MCCLLNLRGAKIGKINEYANFQEIKMTFSLIMSHCYRVGGRFFRKMGKMFCAFGKRLYICTRN